MPGITLISQGSKKSDLPDIGSGGFLGDIASSANGTLTAGIYHQTKRAEEEALEFTYKCELCGQAGSESSITDAGPSSA